jgi:hypothetical protein
MSEKRCEECGGELSYCGDMDVDGPRLDCLECRLKARLDFTRNELALELAHREDCETALAAARDFGEKFKARTVIILFVTDDDRIGYASYGRTPKLCAGARKVADKCYDAAMNTIADDPSLVEAGR